MILTRIITIRINKLGIFYAKQAKSQSLYPLCF